MEMEELPVKGISFDGYVMLNGQICLDGEKQLVYDFPIATEDTKKLVAVFEKRETPIMLVGMHAMYINLWMKKLGRLRKQSQQQCPR